MMNSLIARGDSRASLRWEYPNPGRSTATRRVRSASHGQTRSKASRLSGHGLSSSAWSAWSPLAANRTVRPPMSRNRISKDAFSQVVTMLLLRARGRVPHPCHRRGPGPAVASPRCLAGAASG